ncbi:MAG: hypothetical protein AVDCRST_MAG21-88, partial [uncultured Nocardioidaceae bacterium]
ARGVRSQLLPRDDPRRPASPGAVVEEGQEAARPGRPAASAGVRRAGPRPAGRRPAGAASAGLPRRSAHPSGCRARLRLVGARPAFLGRLGLAAFGGQALLLRPLPLQRGRGAALALCPRQRRAHHRCPAPAAGRMARPEADRRVGRRSLSSCPHGAGGSHRVADRTRALAGLQPGLHAGRGPLALAPGGRHLPPLPSHRRRSQPPCRRFRGAPQSGSLHRRRPPLGQGSARSRGRETTLPKL